MSYYKAIADVGETLIELLRNNMQDIEGITEDSIVLASPGEIGDKNVWISIFLYQVVENPFLKNQEMQIKNTKVLKFPPVALDLYYMITTYTTLSDNFNLTDKTKQAQETLGRVVQILNDNSILTGSVLKGEFAGSTDEIHITLTSISLDDMTKIWTTFQGKPFRTSICCIVSPVMIYTDRELTIQRVMSKQFDNDIIVPNSAKKD